MNTPLSPGKKQEIRERLAHDAGRVQAGNRRSFLRKAAATLVAAGAGGAEAMAAARDSAPASLKITDLKTRSSTSAGRTGRC